MDLIDFASMVQMLIAKSQPIEYVEVFHNGRLVQRVAYATWNYSLSYNTDANISFRGEPRIGASTIQVYNSDLCDIHIDENGNLQFGFDDLGTIVSQLS